MKHARSDYDRIQDPAGLIPADEPVFLLRGQDLVAPFAVRMWARNAELAGADPAIVASAIAQAEAMERWHEAGHHKVPDMPKAPGFDENEAEFLQAEAGKGIPTLTGKTADGDFIAYLAVPDTLYGALPLGGTVNADLRRLGLPLMVTIVRSMDHADGMVLLEAIAASMGTQVDDRRAKAEV